MLKDFKEHPYFESDSLKLLNKFLEKGFIEPPQSNHLEEIRRIDEPKYRKYRRIIKYHKIIHHPIEKSKAFKEQNITLDKKVPMNLTGCHAHNVDLGKAASKGVKQI